ncbi:hypothetical protein LG71_07840 [Pluralibacter gergoviae]|nr:hypothetical protein LG71_07840 [Pluralibacter gergoviae]
MDGVAGLTVGGIDDGRVAVPEIRRHRQRKLSPVPARDGDADAGERWIQAMPGHRSVESTHIYTQVSIRALQAVHTSTPPAAQRAENEPDVADEN